MAIDPSQVDTVDCDFMIVGAGSSGCVLASRLVRHGLKVLLVEKGPADANSLSEMVRRPSDWMRQASSGKDLSEVFMTVPQAGLDGRRLHAFRGKGGGGTSNINAALYCRGSKEDYEDHWPWDIEDVKTSFESVEAELTLEDHQTSGTVKSTTDRMLEESGFEPPPVNINKEVTWTNQGLGQYPLKRTTTKGGERQSAWAAFVSPVADMPNLRIKDDANVSRIIIEGGRAVGIETSESVSIWKGGGTRVRQLRLAKETAEIILCCGVFRTPKLLMLSGVGPRDHLEEKGIEVVADLPQVGQNLHDHVVLLSLNTSKKSMAKEDYAEDGVHGLTYFSCPIPSGSAPASDDVSPSCSSSAVVGFTYMDGGGQAKDLPILVGMMMAKPGFLNAVLRTVMVMLCRVAVFLLPMDRMLGDRRSLLLLITTIKSRGTVRLASKDTRAHPLIDPGYLSHPQDQQTACACWQRLRQAKTETATGKEFFGEEILPGKRFNYGNDDESFKKYARKNAFSFFHPVGTCRMGDGVDDSVVSAENLRVHGISGLRVADASICPRIPSTPTQAMAMMIGDRAASIALKDMPGSSLENTEYVTVKGL